MFQVESRDSQIAHHRPEAVQFLAFGPTSTNFAPCRVYFALFVKTPNGHNSVVEVFREKSIIRLTRISVTVVLTRDLVSRAPQELPVFTYPVTNIITAASSVEPSSKSRPVGVNFAMGPSLFSLIFPPMIFCEPPTSIGHDQ